jgi:hypothetical protein
MDRDQPISPGTLRSLVIRFGEFGLTDRAACLGFCAAVLGRVIESRKELTAREASAVLDCLEASLPKRPAHVG